MGGRWKDTKGSVFCHLSLVYKSFLRSLGSGVGGGQRGWRLGAFVRVPRQTRVICEREELHLPGARAEEGPRGESLGTSSSGV